MESSAILCLFTYAHISKIYLSQAIVNIYFQKRLVIYRLGKYYVVLFMRRYIDEMCIQP